MRVTPIRVKPHKLESFRNYSKLRITVPNVLRSQSSKRLDTSLATT